MMDEEKVVAPPAPPKPPLTVEELAARVTDLEERFKKILISMGADLRKF